MIDSYRRARRSCVPVHGLAGGQSVPVLVGGGAFEVLVFPQHASPRGVTLFVPSHVARCALVDGELIELRPHPRGEGGPLGACPLPAGYDRDRFAAAKRQYLLSLDQLAPGFEAGRGADAELCRETLALYAVVVTPVLRPFLDPLGAAFLAWLRAHGA